MRVGSHDGYGRVVFDLPTRTDYQITQQGQQVVVRFTGDMTIGSAAGVPHNVLGISGGPSQAELTVAPGTSLRDWRLGDHIVIDIWDHGAGPTTQPAAPQLPRQGTTSRPPEATRPVNGALPAEGAINAVSPPLKQQPVAAPVLAHGPANAQPPATQVPTTTLSARPAPSMNESATPAAPVPVQGPASAQPAATPIPPLTVPVQPPPSMVGSATPAVPSPDQSARTPAAQPAPVAEDAVPAVTKDQEAPQPDSALVVPFDAPVGIAAFRRGNAAIIVIDQRRQIDTAPLHDDPVFGTASVQTLPAATVVRIKLEAGMALSVSKTAHAWRITAVPAAPKLRPIAATMTDNRLVLSASAPGTVVTIADPETGTTLLVGTQLQEGQGISALRRSAEFVLLPTWQGVAVEAIADTLALLPVRDGFVLTGGPDGLALSPPSDVARTAGTCGRPDTAVRLSELAEPGFDAAPPPTSGRRRDDATACAWPETTGGSEDDDLTRPWCRGAGRVAIGSRRRSE